MKKIIAAVLTTLAIGQTQAQVTVKPGIRAGMNISNITNTNFDSKTDFYLGGMVSIKLASFYTLQPELNYSRQGAKGRYTYFNGNGFDPIVTTYTTDHDYAIQYLSLGIMNKFSFGQGFHAIVGPTLDFRVGDSFPDIPQRRPSDFDVALNGGIGYTLPMGLTIEARYKMGFVDVFGDIYNEGWNDDDWDDDYNEDLKLNSVIQLGVSYSF